MHLAMYIARTRKSTFLLNYASVFVFLHQCSMALSVSTLLEGTLLSVWSLSINFLGSIEFIEIEMNESRPSDVPRHLLLGEGDVLTNWPTIFTKKGFRKYCCQLSCSMATFWPTVLQIWKHWGARCPTPPSRHTPE